jgi:oligopeptide transport system substrate-binding protein
VKTTAFGFSNPPPPGPKDYAALLDEAALTADTPKRFAILQRAESILLDEAPITPLVFGARIYLVHPAVKNWHPSPLGLNRFHLVELRN